MNDSPTRRRFIAGAVCPRCGLMDKIIVNLDTDQRECVSCDFKEVRPGDEPGKAGPVVEVQTRVSRPAARRVETPAEPVTLIDPAEKNR